MINAWIQSVAVIGYSPTTHWRRVQSLWDRFDTHVDTTRTCRDVISKRLQREIAGVWRTRYSLITDLRRDFLFVTFYNTRRLSLPQHHVKNWTGLTAEWSVEDKWTSAYLTQTVCAAAVCCACVRKVQCAVVRMVRPTGALLFFRYLLRLRRHVLT